MGLVVVSFELYRVRGASLELLLHGHARAGIEAGARVAPGVEHVATIVAVGVVEPTTTVAAATVEAEHGAHPRGGADAERRVELRAAVGTWRAGGERAHPGRQ